MARSEKVFSTTLYRAELKGSVNRNRELLRGCLAIAADDAAGQRWSKRHGYKGYTSYASLNDLPQRNPEFLELAKALLPHAKKFAQIADFDLSGRKLMLDSLWINVLEQDGVHSGHIHPHSVISGTYYVAIPAGASAIRFEDPRLPLMMAAPMRRQKARLHNRSFVSIAPKSGTLLLWESWLRHEVPANAARGRRISISFNYSLI